MKIYQPMVFVGLGGTGCLIGAELERRLRDALCGPDGTSLGTVLRGRQLLPFQLPDCLQFVYADLNESELNRLPYLRAEGRLKAAYGRTSRATFDLLPRYDSYPEVARSLRTNLPDQMRAWVPPRLGEPRIAPLIRGAGQLPTVGRAALFETFRGGLSPALAPLQEAIDMISRSGGDLASLGGTLHDTCDVFVAFSVAGGTGAGIFYDYLHLIAHAFEEARYRVKIYPLVLMPSAFDEDRGGGRAAQLNAGRALIDLFRLVDDQNVPDVDDDLDDIGLGGRVGVRYPTIGTVTMRPSTMQTAFLFSRTSGIEREDLHRSVVSLVLSLLGTELADDDGRRDTGDLFQSFADSFINDGVHRAAAAPSGIGHRGVSTSLVASMTVPVDELTEVVAGRLMAAAVRQDHEQPRWNGNGDARALVKELFGASNLDPLWSRTPLKFAEPRPATGARQIVDALAGRQQAMEDALGDLDRGMRQLAAELAAGFDPVRGVRELLTHGDLFQVNRVVVGNPGAEDRVERAGFAGMLESRRREPERPGGLPASAPQPQGIRDRMARLVKAKWTDPEVIAFLQQQDEWYAWEARRIWHRHWADQAPRWDRGMSQLRAELGALVEEFREYAVEEETQFAQRTRQLYRPRTGVSYLLPPQTDLLAFYDAVVQRLLAAEGLRPTDGETALLSRLIGADQWRAAFAAARSATPRAAVGLVKEHLQQRIKQLFVESGGVGERPLLPSLGALLSEAASGQGTTVGDEAVEQYRHKLASMIPAGFSPEGTGRLKVLIVYPATSSDPVVRRFLARELALPRESDRSIEFRPVATESVTVVLFRSSMSLIEVPEVRETLSQWAGALIDERAEDYLMWRQRLGHAFDSLASTERDRVHILHRLLCAMWNNQVDVLGDVRSPRQIRVRLQDRDSAAMICALEPYEPTLSSWGSLLHAYEEWTLVDDAGGIRGAFCEQLMSAAPNGVDGNPRPPSGLFIRFVHEIAPRQARRLRELDAEARGGAHDGHVQLRHFWTRTLPAALELPFPRARRPVRHTLKELDETFWEPESAGEPQPPRAGPPPPMGADDTTWDIERDNWAEAGRGTGPARGGRPPAPWHEGAISRGPVADDEAWKDER
ncbi:tubulin-like doman-containing protein [Wenjunlia tyrosinilytica]|uniref:Tubulin-like protein n=1 Tax=Wenjunlia tyrosinilytica TaxID=1544741 RepID=A0A917ZIY0_9ACTN|nr:tubulin-like doman-containing protein [Wenjunlia tyrosinilytica]GGO84195.1 hypothetical protein GCM10012280_15110 [Wenjunlia tyrosinilytica]